MSWIVTISTALVVIGFGYAFVCMFVHKLRKVDMPRARGVGALLFLCGLGQWSVICLGLIPYFAGQGVSLSRRLKYFSAASDPVGALTGMLFHVALGLFMIGLGIFFGLRLIRHSSLAKA